MTLILSKYMFHPVAKLNEKGGQSVFAAQGTEYQFSNPLRMRFFLQKNPVHHVKHKPNQTNSRVAKHENNGLEWKVRKKVFKGTTQNFLQNGEGEKALL